MLERRVEHFCTNWPAVDHFAFVIDNFGPVEDYLRTRGVVCRRFGGENGSVGITQVMLLDPDGNVVELSDCAPPIGAVR